MPFKVSATTSNFMIGVTAAASAGVYFSRGYKTLVLMRADSGRGRNDLLRRGSQTLIVATAHKTAVYQKAGMS